MIPDLLLSRLASVPEGQALMPEAQPIGGDFETLLVEGEPELLPVEPMPEDQPAIAAHEEVQPALPSMPLGVAVREAMQPLPVAGVTEPSDQTLVLQTPKLEAVIDLPLLEDEALPEEFEFEMEEAETPPSDMPAVALDQIANLPVAQVHMPVALPQGDLPEPEAAPSIEVLPRREPALERPKEDVEPPLPEAALPLKPTSEAASINRQPQPLEVPIKPFEMLLAPSREAVKSPVAPQAVEKVDVPPLVRNVIDRMEQLTLEPGSTKLLLKPQGMGLLEIDLRAASDGRMSLAIRAENPMVLEALRQESGALSLFMGSKGFDLSGGEPQLEHYQRPKPSDLPTVEAEEEDLASEEDTLAANGLNIMT